MRLNLPTALLASLLMLFAGAATAAEEVTTPAGTLDLPDGFRVIQAQGSESQGGRLFVFVRDTDPLPRAIFMLTVSPLSQGALTVDAAVAAAQLADPTMLTPDGRPARRVKFGGVRGHRSSTLQSNQMVSTAYAVDHGGFRILVQIKYPGTPDYRADALRFEKALRAFRWTGIDPGVAAEAAAEAEALDAADALPFDTVEAPIGAAPAAEGTAGEPVPPSAAVWEDIQRVGVEDTQRLLAPRDATTPTAAEAATPSPPADAAPPTAVWENIERHSVEDTQRLLAAPVSAPAAAAGAETPTATPIPADDGDAPAQPAPSGVWENIERHSVEETQRLLAPLTTPAPPAASAEAEIAPLPMPAPVPAESAPAADATSIPAEAAPVPMPVATPAKATEGGETVGSAASAGDRDATVENQPADAAESEIPADDGGDEEEPAPTQ